MLVLEPSLMLVLKSSLQVIPADCTSAQTLICCASVTALRTATMQKDARQKQVCHQLIIPCLCRLVVVKAANTIRQCHNHSQLSIA